MAQSLTEQRRIVKNILASGIGQVLGFGLLFLANVLTARFLGPQGYGDFSFLMSLAILVWFLAETGLTTVFMREIVSQTHSLALILGEFLGLALLLAAAGYLAFIGAVFILTQSLHLLPEALLLGISLLLMLPALTMGAVFRAKEVMEFNAFGFVLHKVVLLICLLVVIHQKRGLLSIILSYVLADLSLLIFYILSLRFRYKLVPGLKINWGNFKKFLAQGIVLGSGQLLRRLCFQLEIILAHRVIGAEGAGLYAAAFRFLQATSQLAQTTAIALFPPLARRTVERASFKKLLARSLTMFGLIGGLIGSVTFLLAPFVIDFFLGENYTNAVPVLRLLSLISPLVFSLPIFFFSLAARHKEKIWLKGQILLIVINIFMGFFLISNYGVFGAGLSRLLSEVLLFGILLHVIL